MKMMCGKLSLYEAVINVSKAVSERCAMPILEGMKLKLSDSLLELTGYDLEIGIRSVVAVRSADKGEFIVNARLFSEMIKKMPSEEIMIELTDSFQVIISGGSTTYNLPALAADEYPALPEKNTEDVIELPQTVFKNMINQTIFAAAVSDIKPILKGELFEIENGMLTLVAIDGYRLAVRNEPIKYGGSKKFVVPSKTLSEVAKLLSDNDEDKCNICVSPKHIIFEINGYLVYSRLLEGEFHPYRSAIPEKSATEVIADRKELISALERAQLLISERTPSPVRCVFEDSRIKINCSTEQGRISDEMRADTAGPALEIGFKCKYFLDPLKAIPDEKVKLYLNSNINPMKIVPVDGDNYIFLVLPVRLSRN